MTPKQREILRYGVTVALGLIVDLGTATVAVRLGAPLELAAVTGVACGAVFNYVLFEVWTFRGPKIVSAAARPIRYLGALGVTMAVRASAVWVLESLLAASMPPLLILSGAVAVSFAANFVLSKWWVFRNSRTPVNPSGG